LATSACSVYGSKLQYGTIINYAICRFMKITSLIYIEMFYQY
jgi:hypothetical protein